MEYNSEALGFTPSQYQKKIFDFIVHGNGNAVISAKAGSGKTSTCIAAIKLIKPQNKVMFLAFNKSVAEELSAKLKEHDNVEVRTSHSLGYAIIRSNVEGDIRVDEFKYRAYLRSSIAEINKADEVEVPKLHFNEYIDNITSLVDFARFNLAQTTEDVRQLAKKYGVSVFCNECEVVIKILNWGKTELNRIDYTDMIWLPVELSMNARKQQKDFIFVDECQDQSLASIELLLKCRKRGTRLIAVGDENQCQPEGTKILMGDGSEKKIEDLYIGDKVMSFARGKRPKQGGYAKEMVPCNVNGIEHHVENDIINVTLENGLTTSYTPSHVCYITLNEEELREKWFLFLTRDREKSLALDFNHLDYTYLSQFSSFWVIGMFNTKLEAQKLLVQEANAFSVRYIKEPKPKRINPYEYSSAMKLLRKYGLNIKEPITAKRKPLLHKKPFRCPAINLTKDIMRLIVIDKENLNKPIESAIVDIEHKKDETIVYSLDVDEGHNYVADGIITHNCINTFAGSSEDAFDRIKNLPNTTLFDLPICYRCPRSVIELVKPIVPSIECRENAPEGVIIDGCWTSTLQSGDLVLCRSKAPLLRLYNKLLHRGIQCYIKGNDIGVNLKKLIDSIDTDVLGASLKEDGLFVRLYDKMFAFRNKVASDSNIAIDDATLSDYVIGQYDIINALEILGETCNTKTDLRSRIDNVFDESKEGVILSTIHKAKGMEADNVFILCNSSMPSSLAKKDWEKAVEQNLIYVAYTRAKKKLGFINEREIKPFGIAQGANKLIEDLGLIENLVCRTLGKSPATEKDNVQCARFNLDNGITEFNNISNEANHTVINNADIPDEDVLTELDGLLD